MEGCKCKPAKSFAQRIIEYQEFVSLVKRMREAQKAFQNAISSEDINEMDYYSIVVLDAEREVDEYLQKREI